MKTDNLYKYVASNDSDQAQKSAIKHATSAIEWQDLRQLSRFQVTYNAILPYLFLLLSWLFASQAWYILACIATYLFFASAFRQAHDGYHYSLGISKRATTGLLLLLSVLLLTSLHSIRATHMQHHRDPLGENDIEGSLAKGSWWQALLGGLAYRFAIYKQGLRLSSQRKRRLAGLEFVLIGLVIVAGTGAVLTYRLDTMLAQVFIYHLLTMILANATVGIIAVWGVHHDCEESVARTERHTVINLLTFNLLYHVEHHLFPAVPSSHLPKLAKRLDNAAPHLTKKRVLPTKLDIQSYFDNLINKIKHKLYDNECPIRKRFA